MRRAKKPPGIVALDLTIARNPDDRPIPRVCKASYR
jgi:hypothetical protein